MPGTKKTEKVPSGALHFMEDGLDSECSVMFADDDGEPKLNMVVYSGGVIKNHWYWGNLAIDLMGIQFPKPKFPVLAQHDIERKIGFTGKPTTDGNLSLNPDKTKFVDTDEANEFKKLAKQGFPFQASMYIPPLNLERVPEGETAEVNGIKLKGPGTIFRKSVFKEASVVVFGADSNTSAGAAFSKDGPQEEIEYFEEGGENLNDLDTKEKEVTKLKDAKEFKEKYPNIFKEVVESAQAELQQELDEANSSNAELRETVDTQATQLEEQGNDIAELKKDKVIRDREALQRKINAEADGIFIDMFEESNVAEDLKDKVREMPCLNAQKFTEDGKFDAAAFKKAVKAELGTWPDETIQGATFTSKGSDMGEATQESKENKQAADDLLALAGQPQDGND